MTIIDSDYQTLTIQDSKGKILIRNIDDYNLLKYEKYNGDRIIAELDKDTSVIETFDDGIFNVKYKSVSMQLKDKIEVAKRLKYCLENNTTEPIKELLQKNIKDKIEMEFLDKMLFAFKDRIKINDHNILINNDMFRINKDGQAFYLNGGEYRSLCIVASKTAQISYNHDLGDVKINFRTIEIYSKVLFLLFPNVKDTVFMNQLPDDLKKYVKDLHKGLMANNE